MGFVLLAAFIGVPLIEIALFIQVGGIIGLWPTIAVVILTAVAGAALLRHQGLGALSRLQETLDRGETPLDPVFDGFCLLAAGMLLLTPGFFTGLEILREIDLYISRPITAIVICLYPKGQSDVKAACNRIYPVVSTR